MFKRLAIVLSVIVNAGAAQAYDQAFYKCSTPLPFSVERSLSKSIESVWQSPYHAGDTLSCNPWLVVDLLGPQDAPKLDPATCTIIRRQGSQVVLEHLSGDAKLDNSAESAVRAAKLPVLPDGTIVEFYFQPTPDSVRAKIVKR